MSNRLTFSLASLIFLIAFGLVFVPTSVLAHDNATADSATTPRVHPHPLTTALAEQTDANQTPNDLGTAVSVHNGHPTLKSIALKEVDGKTSGNMVVITADDAATTDVNEHGLDLVVTFNEKVNTTDGNSVTVTATDLLAAGNFTVRVRNANNVTVTGAATVSGTAGAVTRVGDGGVAFNVPVTFDTTAIPNGTADAPLEYLTFYVQVNDAAVYSLATSGGVGNDIPGGSNYAAPVPSAQFKLVKELPPVDDSEPPTVTVTAPAKANADGTLSFTFTFSEALGTGANAFTAGDVTIMGGTLADFTGPAAGNAYTVTVTPSSATAAVTVSLNPDAVADAADPANLLTDVTDATATYDKTPPTVTITAPTAPETDGKLKFTFVFSEPIDAATFKSEDIEGEDYVVTDAPMMDATDTMMKTWTAKVEPTGDDDVTIVLNVGAVADKAGNTLVNGAFAKYTPPGPPTKETVPPTVTIGATGYMVGTTVKGLNCEVGNELTFTYADPTSTPAASGVKTGSMVTVSEISVPANAGWEITQKATTDPIMLVPKTDGSALGVTAVTVTVAAGAIEDNNGNKSVKTMMTFAVGPVLTIPAGGYVVVIRTNAFAQNTHLNSVRTLYLADPNVDSRNLDVQYWDCMPDLSLVFDVKPTATHLGGGRRGTGGGGLLLLESYEQDKDLTKQAITKGTVGISEIMWAQDQGIPFGRDSNLQHAREQWIEIHNLNSDPVKVTLFDLYGKQAYHTVSYDHEIDRVSNFNIGGRWEAGDRGQDGNSDTGIDFISMKRTTGTPGEKDYDHGDHAGNNGGKWSKSGDSYLTRRAALADRGIDLGDNNLYDFYGTPGRANGISHAGPDVATPIPLKPFIIHEVSNRENRLYEWIEIRNTSGGEANLRNYMVSVVRSKGNEYALFTFPNSDIKVPKDGLVLIVSSDPEDDGEHPLAVGHDIRGGNDQAPGVNADSAKYIVAGSGEKFATEGMPDDGNFLLVLRRSEKVDAANASAKLKTHEWIIDVAGYHNNLGNPNSAADNYSALWPLKVRGAPFSKNKINKDMVYHRRDIGRPGVYGENNNDKPSFVRAGYTGIGYRRHAQNTAAHGGTPGYHDTRQSLIANVTDGIVRISEIMVDQGDGRVSLPQWIEIHNSSPTKAINLHGDDGWRLVIENYDDGEIPVARISGTLNFKKSEVQTLLPKQTVLVASTRARSAGSASINASVVFIPTRVFSVWSDERGALGMARSTDPILSEKGFHIELVDGKNNTVDEVGNLTKRRGRIAAQTVWELSEVDGVSENADSGSRSSLVRMYKKDGTASMGTSPGGWISANATNYRRYVDTWYGDENDIGSPGATIGGVLPVSLSKFRPERLESGDIVIRWITESETNNAGFNILRSETRNGQFTQINTSLIAGQGTTSEKTNYEWKDTTAKPNVVYYYQIQDVSLDGKVQTLRQSRLKGYLTPAGKLTTTWGDLKALQ